MRESPGQGGCQSKRNALPSRMIGSEPTTPSRMACRCGWRAIAWPKLWARWRNEPGGGVEVGVEVEDGVEVEFAVDVAGEAGTAVRGSATAAFWGGNR